MLPEPDLDVLARIAKATPQKTFVVFLTEAGASFEETAKLIANKLILSYDSGEVVGYRLTKKGKEALGV